MFATLFSSRFQSSLAILLLVTMCSVSSAQEEPSTAVTKSKSKATTKQGSGAGESEVSDRLKLADKESLPTGRLPRYFAAVVDQKQRFQIYEIQSMYRVKIEAIERQLADLLAAQMKEIEQVLTARQLQRVEEMRSQPRPSAGASAATEPSSP